jgi:hypothetical protein
MTMAIPLLLGIAAAGLGGGALAAGRAHFVPIGDPQARPQPPRDSTDRGATNDGERERRAAKRQAQREAAA